MHQAIDVNAQISESVCGVILQSSIGRKRRRGMNPIYDSHGGVVGWLKDINIYNLNGSHAAVIKGEHVYGHTGQHLGLLKNGLFRDQAGGAVAFIKGAQGGPIKPVPSIPPIPPIPSIPPIPAIPAIPPISAIPSLSWGKSWQEFIAG